jgi:hypothetical protein
MADRKKPIWNRIADAANTHACIERLVFRDGALRSMIVSEKFHSHFIVCPPEQPAGTDGAAAIKSHVERLRHVEQDK